MDTLRICKQCRQPLAESALEGLCPACLAKVALGSEPSAKTDSTLTIGPEVFVRVRYIGDYELQQEIARGGMGVVYKARQVSLNRIVAVKMILAGKFASEPEMQRFRREAEAAANLQHPNIVAIHEVGEHDGQHYYSMDYVEGRDLGAVVREGGPLLPTQATECLKTIAEAVHFAHQRGTLHRDLKPQNVLMDAAGHPRITDFGLAKFVERDDSLTETGAAMGSPSYMPPEQAAGHLDQVGPHSDVYSLGAILYELLTARPPFRAETPVATMRLVMDSDPVSPRKLNAAVPPDLETICLKCLEKNPARRYHSAQALSDELGRFLNHEPIQARPASAIRKAESWLRRNPWTLMAVISSIALVLLCLFYYQLERAKFLEHRPLAVSPFSPEPIMAMLQLGTWKDFAGLANLVITLTFLLFKQSEKTDWKQFFVRPFGAPPVFAEPKPVSQPMRVVCGLIAVAVMAFTVLYFAKLIHFWVWEKRPPFSLWMAGYAGFYFSLTLLFLLVRDYQKSAYGAPSRTLSAGQKESLRQMLREGDFSEAVKAYRRMVPGVSLAEAIPRVEKFSRDDDVYGVVKEYRKQFPGASSEEALAASAKLAADYSAKLRATHPELFPPLPKLWDLNWWLMAKTLLVEAGVFAIICMLMPPPVLTAARLLIYAAWFLGGAGVMTLMRLKSSWKRFVGMTLCFLLPAIAMPVFYRELPVFLVGFLAGMFMIVSGFTPKRRKFVRGKSSCADAPPPH